MATPRGTAPALFTTDNADVRAGKVKGNKDGIIPVHKVHLSRWAVEECVSFTFVFEHTGFTVLLHLIKFLHL